MRVAWTVIAVAACSSAPPAAVVIAPVAPVSTAPPTVTPVAPVSPVAPVGPTCTSALRGNAPPTNKVVDSNGDRLELVPVETWHVLDTGWAGEDLILLRRIAQIGYGGHVQSAIERWTPPDHKAPRVRTLLAGDARAMAVTLDGTRIVLAFETAIAIHDAATGAEQTRFSIAGRLGVLATAGTGDRLLILASLDHEVVVFDRHGGELARYAVGGTTPTIRRVYNNPDHPTHHDNILKSAPSWAEAIAASADGRWVAIGSSDSNVQIHDRKRGGKPRVVSYKWKYTERRHRGGNPDLNSALAMRFSADTKRLVVVYRKGDVITWDVARGTQVAKLAGTCTQAEATTMANRYTEPSQKARVPTAEDLAECGPATKATIAPDGSWYASDIGLVRLRKLPTGAPIAILREPEIPGELVISNGGTLGVVDIYGHAALWNPSTGPKDFLPAPLSTGPISPQLSRSGRVLVFELGTRVAAWDLTTGANLAAAPPDNLVAISDDASQQIVATKAGFELRAAGRRQPLALPAGRLVFSGAATHVLDIAQSGELVVLDLAKKTKVTIKPPDFARPVLRDDGRWLATFGERAPLQIWDTRTGKAVATLETNIAAVAFFGDGKRMVTVHKDRKAVTAKIRDLAGKVSAEIPFTGWLVGVDISPDDRELLFAFEDRVIRHSLLDQTQHETHTIGQRRARYASSDTIMLEGFNQIEIRRTDDALTLLGHVYPLLSGGYLLTSTAGAAHGSADAPDSIVSRTTSTKARLLTGRETWSLWAQPDTYACALAGQIATPP
jgi:WD40 repeat protein